MRRIVRPDPVPAASPGLAAPVAAAVRRAVLPAAVLLAACADSTGPPVEARVFLIEVRPTPAQVAVGGTLALTARAFDADGVLLEVTFAWSSDEPEVLEVDGAGVVTGRGPGSATVRARAGDVTGSALVTVPVPPPPAAPTDVTATTLSSSAIRVEWTDASNDETRFEVVRSVGQSGFETIATTGPDVTGFTDEGLPAGTRVQYLVGACHAFACSIFVDAGEAFTAGLRVVTEAFPVARVGAAYDAGLVATGGVEPYAWSLLSGALPDGLALAPDGRVTGTPTAPTEPARAFTVQVEGADGDTATADLHLVVYDVLELAPAALDTGRVGEVYADGVAATGGDGLYAFEVVAGALPPGLSVSDPSGVISGTPEEEGDYAFTLRVTSGDGQSAEEAYAVTVLPPLPKPVSILTTVLQPGLVSAPYGTALEATGGDPAAGFTWSLVAGALPAGLSLSPDGALGGVPTEVGTATFTVRAESGAEEADHATFSVEVVADDPASYDIVVLELVDVAPAIRAHVDAAVARWEEIVVGDIMGGTVPEGLLDEAHCGGFGPVMNGASIDDVVVMVLIEPIDGGGGVLGQAGPCLLDDDGLPALGGLILDEDDLSALAGTETLTSIVFHEIGHILGFGSLWRSRDLLDEATPADPRFTGLEATAAHQALGGFGFVPVEASGGAGTAGAHWRESVYDREVMTGFSEPVGVPQPVSRVTVASMADLGYTVDPSAADPFTLAQPSGAVAREGSLGWDRLYDGPVARLPGSRR